MPNRARTEYRHGRIFQDGPGTLVLEPFQDRLAMAIVREKTNAIASTKGVELLGRATIAAAIAVAGRVTDRRNNLCNRLIEIGPVGLKGGVERRRRVIEKYLLSPFVNS